MHHWTLYMGLSMELLFGDICNWMQLLNNEDANLLPGQGRRSFHSHSLLKCDDPESEWNKEIHSERTKVMMCSTDWSPFVWLLGRWISHAYRQGSWLDNVPTPPLFFFWRSYCVLICFFGFKSNCKLENNLFPHKIASDSVLFWKSIYLTQNWRDLRLTPWYETQTQDYPGDQEPDTK